MSMISVVELLRPDLLAQNHIHNGDGIRDADFPVAIHIALQAADIDSLCHRFGILIALLLGNDADRVCGG